MPDEPRRPNRAASRSVFDLLAFGLILIGAFALYFARTEKLVLSPKAEHQIKGLIDWGLMLCFVAAGVGLLVLVRLAREMVVLTTHQAQSSAQAAQRIEQLVPVLDRIAAALERSAAQPANVLEPDLGNTTAASPQSTRADAIRRAIREGLWEEARSLAETFAASSPDSTEARQLIEEVDQGRETAANSLRARLEASRTVNDPEAVLEYREQLLPLLSPGDRRDLDRDLIRWLLALLMRRLRTGTVRTDVAELAARVAELFPDTPEGASLRASLPTLRRSAGLCPRCAQPYRGVEDACPECLAAVPGPTILPLRDENDTPDPDDDDLSPPPPAEDGLIIREPD